MRLFKWIGSVLVSVFLMVTAVTAKEEGYCVEGKVLDEKGHPVQGASFTLYQYGAVMKDAVITNAKGEWKITELPAGDYVLSQESSPYGYEMMEKPLAISLQQDKTLVVDTIRNAHMEGSVRIWLQDEKGKAIAKMSLQVLDEQNQRCCQGETNQEGMFMAEHLFLGNYRLAVLDEHLYKENEEGLRFTMTSKNHKQIQNIYFHLQKKSGNVSFSHDALYLFFGLCLIACGSIWWYLHYHGFQQLRKDFM